MAAQAQKSGAEDDLQSRAQNDYQRLLDQASFWRRASEEVLDSAGLKPGMSCLDVGSGPGAVMRLMAERVGPEGQVTSIEIDGNLGRKALADLRAQGGAKFESIDADVGALEDVPGAPFDLTYARMFLMHMQDPVEILEKMLHWTKPGGVVAGGEHRFPFAHTEREGLRGDLHLGHRLGRGGAGKRQDRQDERREGGAGRGRNRRTAASQGFREQVAEC